jgi:hypothetical protein
MMFLEKHRSRASDESKNSNDRYVNRERLTKKQRSAYTNDGGITRLVIEEPSPSILCSPSIAIERDSSRIWQPVDAHFLVVPRPPRSKAACQGVFGT